MRYHTHYHTHKRDREAWETVSQAQPTYNGHSGFEVVAHYRAAADSGLTDCDALKATAQHFHLDPDTVYRVVNF